MGRDEVISIPASRGRSICKSKASGKCRKFVKVCINWGARDV